MKKCSLRTVALVSALAIGAGFSAQATVTLTFTWDGTSYDQGFNDEPYITTADAIGIYAFNTPDPKANPIYSVCLSPEGLLGGGTYTYNVDSFAEVNPGIFPNQWAWNGNNSNPQYWGIQNAAYLWNTFGMQIVNGKGASLGLSGSANDQAAALEFAIWDVLYNSTGYGKVDGKAYGLPTDLTTGENTDINKFYVAALLNTGGNIPIYNGSILEGTGAPKDGPNGGDDQEFFLLGTPVPEPTTVIAGAMMLLPLGLSALRILRRKRAA